MTDKLQIVKEALEVSIKYAEDSGVPKNAEPWEGEYLIWRDNKQALAELNSYIEARDSEEMVERVASIIKSNDFHAGAGGCSVTRELDSIAKQKAKAAIKAISGINRARDSEEMVERVANAIEENVQYINLTPEDVKIVKIKEAAKAAIKAMEGNDND